jgi:16S rRNA C967 or C1407 C5-methylase (RsmB/RsmF family)
MNHTVPSLKYILYITRSTAKEENEQVVDTFIKTNKEWTPVPLESISSSFAPFAGEQAIGRNILHAMNSIMHSTSQTLKRIYQLSQVIPIMEYLWLC